MARSCALAALDSAGRQLIGLIGFEDPGTACRDGRRTSVPSTQLQKPLGAPDTVPGPCRCRPSLARRCGRQRPSLTCHGSAVADVRQPPPPSTPGPMVRWWAGLLTRGCGGRAFARINGGRGGPQASSRGCAASWAFRAESGGLADQFSRPPAGGFALCRSIAPQRPCPLLSAFVLVE